MLHLEPSRENPDRSLKPSPLDKPGFIEVSGFGARRPTANPLTLCAAPSIPRRPPPRNWRAAVPCRRGFREPQLRAARTPTAYSVRGRAGARAKPLTSCPALSFSQRFHPSHRHGHPQKSGRQRRLIHIRARVVLSKQRVQRLVQFFGSPVLCRGFVRIHCRPVIIPERIDEL